MAEREMSWRPAAECAINGVALILLGDSIPEVPDIRVGTRISGESAEELGYRSFAKYGGWLIWNDGSDFYVIDLNEPVGWLPIPGTAASAHLRLVSSKE